MTAGCDPAARGARRVTRERPRRAAQCALHCRAGTPFRLLSRCPRLGPAAAAPRPSGPPPQPASAVFVRSAHDARRAARDMYARAGRRSVVGGTQRTPSLCSLSAPLSSAERAAATSPLSAAARSLSSALMLPQRKNMGASRLAPARLRTARAVAVAHRASVSAGSPPPRLRLHGSRTAVPHASAGSVSAANDRASAAAAAGRVAKRFVRSGAAARPRVAKPSRQAQWQLSNERMQECAVRGLRRRRAARQMQGLRRRFGAKSAPPHPRCPPAARACWARPPNAAHAPLKKARARGTWRQRRAKPSRKTHARRVRACAVTHRSARGRLLLHKRRQRRGGEGRSDSADVARTAKLGLNLATPCPGHADERTRCVCV
jgi:hypothetical protein